MASAACDGRPVFILNEDNDHYFKKSAKEMTREALEAYVDNFARGHVTHFFMCPSGQRASFDSKTVEPIWMGIGETAETTTATAADGTHDRWALNAKILFDAGIDPYEVWTKRCREKGVSPWFTIRMNDVHGMGFGPNVRAKFRTTGFHRTRREGNRLVTQEVVSQRHPLYAAIRTGERLVGRTYSFMTPGAAGASRFAVLNDTHCQWDSFAFVTAALKKMKAPLAIWNGDALNCTENRRTAVEAFLHPDVQTKDYAAETPIAFLYGNHEYCGHHVQLVVAGHEHLHRWDENIPGHTWKQVLGGGPECGYGAGYKPYPQHCPTIIEGEVKDGKLVVTTHDVWRNKVLSVREFEKRI